MRFVRTILALIIALSVAIVPVAGSAAPLPRTQATTDKITAHSHAMSEMAEAMDCCTDQATSPGVRPCDQAKGHCDPMAFCAAQSVSLADPAIYRFGLPRLAGNALLVPADQVVSLHAGNPPFRPPRV
jgi:hypothetical protein